jgi:hypothetical protein
MVGGSDPRFRTVDEFVNAEKDRMKQYHDSIDRLTGTEKEGGAKAPSFSFYVNLDGDLAQYGPDIRRFIDAMVYKLEKNAHKGRWEGLSIEEAFDLLKREVQELDVEVHGTRNMIKTTLEAADVANFALMVAAIAMERGR